VAEIEESWKSHIAYTNMDSCQFP